MGTTSVQMVVTAPWLMSLLLNARSSFKMMTILTARFLARPNFAKRNFTTTSRTARSTSAPFQAHPLNLPQQRNRHLRVRFLQQVMDRQWQSTSSLEPFSSAFVWPRFSRKENLSDRSSEAKLVMVSRIRRFKLVAMRKKMIHFWQVLLSVAVRSIAPTTSISRTLRPLRQEWLTGTIRLLLNRPHLHLRMRVAHRPFRWPRQPRPVLSEHRSRLIPTTILSTKLWMSIWPKLAGHLQEEGLSQLSTAGSETRNQLFHSRMSSPMMISKFVSVLISSQWEHSLRLSVNRKLVRNVKQMSSLSSEQASRPVGFSQWIFETLLFT